MALGPSEYTVKQWFNVLFNNAAFWGGGGVAQTYLQLHIGDPGAAGTGNLAADTRRHAVMMGSPSMAGGIVSIANDVQLQITSLAGAQDATHYSLWDNSPTGGTFVGNGLITAPVYAVGDTLTFPIGSIIISMPCAA